jgi:glucose/arabinose dehydrogenase
MALIRIVLSLSVLSVTACAHLQDWRDEQPGIRIGDLRTASGYSVSVLSAELPKARQMALGERGNLFVGSSAGNVYLLRLAEGRAYGVKRILSGLKDPQGIAMLNGTLFVSDRTRVVRYDRIEDRLDDPPRPIEVIGGFPSKARHGAHVMRVGPDGKLYIAVGAPCDVCKPDGDEFGTIIRVNADGSGKEVVARGIRNSVGYDWHPSTKQLYFTDNGQDDLGPDRPNDELNRVVQTGAHFGFPYCHDSAIADPKFGTERPCSDFVAPALGLGARVAALGMRFYNSAGKSGGDPSMIIVARHGSHPPVRVGYDVVSIDVQDGTPTGMKPFLTGFLQGHRYWGRPTDVLVLPGGDVLISDDLNGAIYRVTPSR